MITAEGRKIEYVGGVAVVQSTEQDRLKYRTLLEKSISILNKELGNGDWAVIGGIAKDSYTRNPHHTVVDEHGNLRDIDILLGRRHTGKIPSIIELMKDVLPIGFPIQPWINLERGNTYLRYGPSRVYVPDDGLFSISKIDFFGVQIPVLPIQTMLRLYGINGIKREKDDINRKTLEDHISQNPELAILTEQQLEPFNGFQRVISERHLERVLLKTAIRYRNSRLNTLIPINSGVTRRVLTGIWSRYCSTGNWNLAQ